MNIAMVGDSISLQSAGSLVSAWRFAVLLARRGHKVVLITTGEKEKFEIVEGVRVYYIPSRKTPFLEGSWRVPIFISKSKLKKIFLDEKIEITHFVIPTPLCYSAIRISRELKLPIVSHFHTQPENILTLLKLRGDLFNSLFYKFSGWFYNQSDVLICPSKFGQERISPYINTPKIEVISNGVNLSEFKKRKPRESFFKKFKIPKNKKIVLFVGRLWPEKNVRTLIKSMQHLKKEKIFLVIVGKKEKQYSYLKKLSKNLLLDYKIFFLGRINSKELNDAYNAATLFCLPSMAELEGIVILEAMAHGKPIIVSNSANSASRFFVEKNGFIFNTFDYFDLASKIKKICSDKKLISSMSSKSLEYVKKYNIERSVDKLISVYSNLLRRSRINKSN